MKRESGLVALLFAFTTVCVVPCHAASTWGDVQGRFVFDGEIPDPPSINRLGKTFSDDSLLVNAKNRGIANIAVYVVPMKRGAIPIHPSHAATANKPVDVRINEGRFIPHAFVVQTAQKLNLINEEEFSVNPVISTARNIGANVLLQSGARTSLTFSDIERQPARASGTVHPSLQGCVLVTDHPYATFTDSNGNFEIANMPSGEWMLQVWHERSGFIKSVVLGGQATVWNKGKVKVHVQPGTYNMKDIRISSKLFKTP